MNVLVSHHSNSICLKELLLELNLCVFLFVYLSEEITAVSYVPRMSLHKLTKVGLILCYEKLAVSKNNTLADCTVALLVSPDRRLVRTVSDFSYGIVFLVVNSNPFLWQHKYNPASSYDLELLVYFFFFFSFDKLLFNRSVIKSTTNACAFKLLYPFWLDLNLLRLLLGFFRSPRRLLSLCSHIKLN